MGKTRAQGDLVSDNRIALKTDSIGIGTTNPTAKLDIRGDANIVGVITATSFVGDGANLTGLQAGYFEKTDVGINTSSNIGIGTTNPTDALTVSGDANVTGVVTASSFVGNLSGTATTATNLNNQAASYYLDYNNFSNTPTIPTNNNQLTNGAGYITSSDGGNAGTLDGLDSTQFLRSDAADSASGVIDFLGGSSSNPAVRVKSGGNNWSEGLAIHPSSDNGYALTFFRTSATLTTNTNTWAIGNLGSNSTNNFGLLRSGLTGGSGITVNSIFDVTQAGVFRFGFNPTVGSNTIWHAGNDGSGSGLDADTLDGYHYNAELGPSAAGNFGQWYGHSAYNDANTVPAAWGWTYLNGTTNAPNTNSNQWYRGRFSLGDQYGYGSDAGDYWMEMAIPRYNQGGSPGNLWVRVCENGAEQSWYQVAATISGNTTWHAGNDGSGSGLDADTLDGIDSGSFLRSDAADTVTGTITFSGTSSAPFRLSASNATSNWDAVTFQATTEWGDSSSYGVLGGDGTEGIMLRKPHVVWNSGHASADIRLGRSGGTSSGGWVNMGIKGSSVGFIGYENTNVLTWNSSGNLSNNGNNYITFGPNSTWSRYLRVGGNGYQGSSTVANIAATNGNLHLDSASGSFATYLNYYAGSNGTHFGNGAGTGIVASVTTTGNMTLNGSVTANGGVIPSSGSDALDYYEEGSWTPTLVGHDPLSLPTVQRAIYTRVGRLVTAYLYLTSINLDCMNINQFRITGLPYNSYNGGYYAGGTVSYTHNTNFDVYRPLVATNNSYIYFHRVNGSSSSPSASDVCGLTHLLMQVYYMTN